MHSLITIAVALTATAFAAPLEPRQDFNDCSRGVSIIAARGTTDAPGEGPIANVSRLIESYIPGSNDMGIRYPAVYWPYQESLAEGTANMTLDIIQYTTRCPNTQIVLIGYSQGAQIIGDVLGGGSKNEPIDPYYMRNVIAAIQYVDPAHVKGKSYDVGTSTRSGRFARKNTTALDQYADILQSYCDHNDIFCDSGRSAYIHTHTLQKYTNATADFVLSKYKQPMGDQPPKSVVLDY